VPTENAGAELADTEVLVEEAFRMGVILKLGALEVCELDAVKENPEEG
jgi:hypothetical protein